MPFSDAQGDTFLFENAFYRRIPSVSNAAAGAIELFSRACAFPFYKACFDVFEVHDARGRAAVSKWRKLLRSICVRRAKNTFDNRKQGIKKGIRARMRERLAFAASQSAEAIRQVGAEGLQGGTRRPSGSEVVKATSEAEDFASDVEISISHVANRGALRSTTARRFAALLTERHVGKCEIV